MYTLHRIIGACAAVLVLVVCVTGVLAVFRNEIEWLLSPTMRVAASHAPADLDAIARSLARDFPEHDLTLVLMPEGPRFVAEARLSKDGAPALDVLVHPRTGAVHAVRSTELVCFSTSDCLRQIHVRLLMGHTGRLFVGAIGVLLLALLATGAALHVVTRGRKAKPRKIARRAPMRLHRTLGIASLPFALLVTITGAVLGLDAWLPSWEESIPRVHASHAPARGETIAARLDDARAALAAHGIEATLDRVDLPTEGDPDFSFAFTEASFFASRGDVRVHVDPLSPGAVAIDLGGRADTATRAYSLLDPLHFGSLARGRGRVMDYATRIVWALLGLSMVAVTLSGMAIVVARLRTSRTKPVRHDAPLPSLGHMR